jgi:branched-chain amino acid transport system permease protein
MTVIESTGKKPGIYERGDVALLGGVLLIAVAVIAAFGQDAYALQLASTAALIGALVLALNIVVGWVHLHSFAQAALYGIGAYTSAILTVHVGVPTSVAFIAAVCVTAAVGFLIAAPSVRIGGPYFAIATIGLQMMVISLLNKGGEVTGGPGGLVGVPPLTIFDMTIRRGVPFFVVASLWLLIVVAITIHLQRSRYGWELRMLGRDEAVASSIGISVNARKIVAFLICAGIAGGTGSLYVHSVGVADPRTFGLPVSATLLVMVLLGGRGSVPAVLISGVLLSFLPEYLRFLSDYRLLAFGCIMVIIILFMPDGLAGAKDSLVSRLGNLRRSKTAPGLVVNDGEGVESVY